jgi:hypothetical protein
MSAMKVRLMRCAVLTSVAAGPGCAKASPDIEVAVAEEAAPPLVRVGRLPISSIRPTLSVWVTRHEVRVVRGVEGSVRRDRVEASANPVDARQHMLAPVHDAVARILAEAPKDDRFVSYYNNGAARVEHAVHMVVDVDVPISTVVDVVYSTGRAGITGYAFALEGSDGAGTIEIVPPQIDHTADPEGPTCVLPRFVFATDGTYVNARLVRVHGGSEVASNDAAWANKLLTASSGACPSLPADASATIAEFSKRLALLGPGCGYAVVAAEGTMTWESIAPSLAALASDAAFVPLVLEAEANVIGSCDASHVL